MGCGVSVQCFAAGGIQSSDRGMQTGSFTVPQWRGMVKYSTRDLESHLNLSYPAGNAERGGMVQALKQLDTSEFSLEIPCLACGM